MPYAIVRKPHMNRVYVTGAVSQIDGLLSDFHARHDDTGYWLPLHMEVRLRDALGKEANYQDGLATERVRWERAIAVIPTDYRQRHGAALGGDILIGGEAMHEPGLATPSLPWMCVASWQLRARDLTGQSTINGRVQERKTLYSAIVSDGRTIYRVAHSTGFGGDQRETYYLPPDLWGRLMHAEVEARGITAEAARQWLERYRGCVGTELYEYALSAGVGRLA